MKKCILLVLFFNGHCYAQTLINPVAFPVTGASALSRYFPDVFSAMANQAVLADMPRFTAGWYMEERFLIKELPLFCLAIACSGKSGGFGLNIRSFGSGEYRQMQAGFGYGKKLGKVNLGIQFGYHSNGAAGSTRGIISAEIGTIWHIDERLHTGLHVFYPASVAAIQKDFPSRSWQAGMGYDASPDVNLAFTVEKEESRSMNIVACIRYSFAQQFFARLGLSSATAQPFGAAGWRKNNFRLEITVSYHGQLGPTPGMALIYQSSYSSPDSPTP